MKYKHSNLTKRIQRIAILTIAICFSIQFNSIASLDNTDFSGNWALNESKSTLGERTFGISPAINVVQDGNNFTLTKTRKNRTGEEMKTTEKYTIDGKKSVNTSGRSPSSSVLTWSTDKKALTITTTSVMERDGQKSEIKTVEIWNLSNEGKTLTINSTSTSSRGERKTTMVYDKQ